MKNLTSIQVLIATVLILSLGLLSANKEVYAGEKERETLALAVPNLPSTAKFLNNVNRAGELGLQSVVRFVKENCNETSKRALGFCNLPELIANYQREFLELTNPEISFIAIDGTSTKAWDLAQLISGNFTLLPNPEAQNSGLEKAVHIFELRTQVLNELSAFDIWLKTSAPRFKGTTIYTGVYLRAYILSVSPLGAAYEVFNNLKCRLDDKACESLKVTWGATNHVIVQQFLPEFKRLNSRIDLVTHDSQSEHLRRLAKILNLSEKVSAGISAQDLTKLFLDIDQDGQGAGVETDYAALTRQIVIFSEVKKLLSMQDNFSPYAIDFSKVALEQFNRETKSTIQITFDGVNQALSNYGIFNELEEK